MRRQTLFLVTVLGAACTADGQRPAPDWQGELASYVIDRGGRAEIEHRLHASDGTVHRLLFADGVGAAPEPGSRLRVWGRPEGGAIRVAQVEVDGSPIPVAASALIDGAKKPTRRWAFVLLDIDGAGNPINKTNAQSVLFSPDRPDSIRSYFREVSYGVQDLDGQVFGPIPYQMGGRCDTDRLASALTAMIPGQFDHYLWFFGTQQPPCDWAGIAQLGRADRPTKHSWFNSFHSCTVLVQEPGHNFGMVHSSAMRCTVNGQPVPFAWPALEGADCQHIEYGNPFDPMGGGDCFHMNGIQKAYQDWLAGCNVIKVSESGTFTIYPLESACDGPQLLQIPFPDGRAFGKAGVLTSYYLELRAPVGYRDQRLTPQVLVMAANDVREARFTGNNNWLLDMTPETRKLGDEALPVGKPFADPEPGGPKFSVLSVDATRAIIQVELGGKPAEAGKPGQAICSDTRPYDPLAMVRCVAPPKPAAPAPGTPDGGPGDGGSGAPPDLDGGGPAPGAGEPGPGAGASVDSGATGGGGGAAPDARRPSPETPRPMEPTRASSGGCQVAPAGAGGAAAAGLLSMLALLLVRRRTRVRS
jgi:MYXO-CTERM domain-containing protein